MITGGDSRMKNDQSISDFRFPVRSDDSSTDQNDRLRIPDMSQHDNLVSEFNSGSEWRPARAAPAARAAAGGRRAVRGGGYYEALYVKWSSSCFNHNQNR